MTVKRRALLGGAAAAGIAGVAGLAVPSFASQRSDSRNRVELPSENRIAVEKKRLTGADLDTAHRWAVAGTDLGIPYRLENDSVGFLFGDTFSGPWPEGGQDHRSPVMLRSNRHPGEPDGIVFDSAAGVNGDGMAPELMYNGHGGDDGAGTHEETVIPLDAVAFPGPVHVMMYMSINAWYHGSVPAWRTNYCGIALSYDGNLFERTPSVFWNNPENNDPFQMCSMQRDGDWVYVISVRSGRQPGPMMLRRVWADPAAMNDPAAYECWGNNNGTWSWGGVCTSIIPEGTYGEPSLRRLSDGTWVMSYGTAVGIVTRRTDSIEAQWSDPTIQVTPVQVPSLYGGFIHPYSTSAQGDLHLTVSRWQTNPSPPHNTTAYDVLQFFGTV